MISRVTPGFFRFAHFLPRGGLFFPGWINSRFARKSGLNRKFQENNSFGTKNGIFYRKTRK